MKLIALGLAAATSVVAAFAASPADAGIYIGVNDGYGYYHRPPPPVYYRPRPYYAAPARVYYGAPPPTRVYYGAVPERRCTVRVDRRWGPYGPVTKRVETCR